MSDSRFIASAAAGLEETIYALDDGRGNISAIADDNGEILRRYVYTPEGRLTTLDANEQTLPKFKEPTYAWRYLYQTGRRDGEGLYEIHGQEHDYLTGGPLAEDPSGYYRQKHQYSVWSALNTPVPDSIADPHGIGALSGAISHVAFNLATLGQYTVALGVARGALAFAGTFAAGAGAGAGIAWASGGDVGEGALMGGELLSGVGAMLPGRVGSAAKGAGAAKELSVPRAVVSEAEGFIGPTIGRSGYRTMSQFRDAVVAKYQGFYDRAFQLASTRAAAGRIARDQTTIGRFTDAVARRDIRRWLLHAEGIQEGPGRIIQVNRRLIDAAGSGAYRIPDVRIPGARLSLDGTIGWKSADTPQLIDIRRFSGDDVLVVRPTQIGGSYGVYFPGK